jgi:hypothetical protein
VVKGKIQRNYYSPCLCLLLQQSKTVVLQSNKAATKNAKIKDSTPSPPAVSEKTNANCDITKQNPDRNAQMTIPKQTRPALKPLILQKKKK